MSDAKLALWLDLPSLKADSGGRSHKKTFMRNYVALLEACSIVAKVAELSRTAVLQHIRPESSYDALEAGS